ncbi:MAG: hypothetical protein AB8G77_26755 [Rhodothermales bacterium]
MVTNVDNSSVDEPNLIDVETRKRLNAIIALDRQVIDECSFSEIIRCANVLLDEVLELIPNAKKRRFKDQLGFVINECHVKEWVGMNRRHLLKEIAEEHPDVNFDKFHEQEQRHHSQQIRNAVSSLLSFEREIYLALKNPSHRPRGSRNKNNPDAVIYSQIISEALDEYHNRSGDFWASVSKLVSKQLEQKNLSLRGDNSVHDKKSYYYHMDRISKEAQLDYFRIPKKPKKIQLN